MKAIRIFLSSPGDVAQERRIAGRVVERLDSEFPTAKLEPYFWEYEPMVITKDYQEQIPAPSSFDIVICILWSRMGSRMHTKYQRDDGRTFRSGTEYEFVDAVEGQKVNDGTPDVLVWINKTQPLIPLEPEDAHMERLRQWRELKSFLEEWTRDGQEGTFKGAVNRYGRLEEFEEKLEIKLRKLILSRIDAEEGQPTGTAPPEITWTDGSPFRGLQPFHFEHAPVFFGRTAAVAEAIEALRRQGHERGSSFLMIAGASGSGKSSLARAGILPMLVEPGVIEGVGLWRRAIMRPADASDPFTAVANALLENHALPEIASDGTTAKELAEMLRDNPAQALGLGRGALSQAAALMDSAAQRNLQENIDAMAAAGRTEDADSASKRLQNLKPPQARLALLIDQFEEIFSSDITDQDRDQFVGLLGALAASGRIFVLATIRSDFFPRCAELPDLLDLTRGDGMLQLGPPTPAELGQMIRQPAQAAGLAFERDTTTGESLDEELRDAAVDQPTILPLLQFCLDELYQRRRDGRLLTFETYRELGGVEGALAQRAEQVFEEVSEPARKAFARVARSTVSLGGSAADETAIRRRADYTQLTAEPGSKELVDALVDARLYVADVDDQGAPSVGVAHEALLRCWPRLSEAIAEDADFLRSRARTVIAAQRWQDEGRDRGYLLPDGKQLSDACALLDSRRDEVATREVEFIEASQQLADSHRNRRIKRLRALAAVLAVLSVGAIAGAYYGLAGQRTAKLQTTAAEQSAASAEAARVQTVETLVQSDITVSSYKPNAIGLAYLARAARNAQDDPVAATALYCHLLGEPHLRQIGAELEGGGPTELRLSANGERLLSYWQLGTVKVWDTSNYQLVVEIKVPELSTATISADGKTVVAAGIRTPMTLFDATTGESRGVSVPNTEGAEIINLNKDGTRLLVWTTTGISVRDLASGSIIGSEFGTDGEHRHIAINAKGDRVALVGDDGYTTVWQPGDGKPRISIATPGASFCDFDSVQGRLAIAFEDGSIGIWDPESGQSAGAPLQHPMPPNWFSVSPRGSRMAVLTPDRKIHLWQIDPLPAAPTGPALSLDGEPLYIDWLEDGRLLITTTQSSRIFSTISNNYIGLPLSWAESGPKSSVIFPDSTRCAIASDTGTIRFFSTAITRRAPIRFPEVNGLDPVFSRDGSRLATVDSDGFVRIWNTATGRPLPVRIDPDGPITCMRFGPRGEQLAGGGGEDLNQGFISIWNATDDSKTGFSVTTSPPIAIDISADGNHLIAASAFGTISGWKVADASSLWDKVHHGGPCHQARFLPGGTDFITSGIGGDIPIWNISGERSGSVINSATAPVAKAFFSPGERTLHATLRGEPAVSWDISTRKTIATHPNLSSGLIIAAADGQVLGMGGLDSGSVSGVVPSIGLQLFHLNHGITISSAVQSPDGTRIATTASDPSNPCIRIWETLPPKPIQDAAFLAEVAEHVGGHRIDPESRAAVSIPLSERQQAFTDLQKRADRTTPEGALALWLLDDARSRKVSPHAQLSVRDHILRDTAAPEEIRMMSLNELLYHYPGHPLVWAGICEAIRENSPKVSEWARSYASKHGESIGSYCQQMAAYLIEDQRFEEARHFLTRAAEEGINENLLRPLREAAQ